jgi:hypothetical protein
MKIGGNGSFVTIVYNMPLVILAVNPLIANPNVIFIPIRGGYSCESMSFIVHNKETAVNSPNPFMIRILWRRGILFSDINGVGILERKGWIARA